jgi:aminobenzoyl-glutamate transport protein
MVPYVLAIIGVWLLLFIAWWLLGIPLGPGSPITA